METFWGELRRRKVIRVAIVYAVGAWVLLQIDYTDAPILELPTWAPKLILVLLVVGFIPALIFACAFDKKTEVSMTSPIPHDGHSGMPNRNRCKSTS